MADDALDPSAAVPTTPPVDPPEDDLTVPEVEFGKVLSVPDNFFEAGYSGKGWTIVNSESKNGQPVVNISRRNIATGAVDTLSISAEKYKAAKAYKDAQRGMSKAKRAPILGFYDLHRAVDPDGEITPEYYDGASSSYRVALPNRVPVWVKDDLIRDVKAGKEGALERLRKEVGLPLDEDTATTTKTTNVRKPTTPTTDLKKEQSLDRPSSQEITGIDEKKVADQTAKEATVKQTDEELLEDDEANSPKYRTQAYTSTQKEGESAQVTANETDSKPDIRLENNRQSAAMAAAKASAIPLNVSESVPAPSDQPASAQTSLSPPEATAKSVEKKEELRPLTSSASPASPVVETALRTQAPKSRQRVKTEVQEPQPRSPSSSQSTETPLSTTLATPTPLRDTLRIPVSIPQGSGGIREVRQELRRQRTGGGAQSGINLTLSQAPAVSEATSYAASPSLPTSSQVRQPSSSRKTSKSVSTASTGKAAGTQTKPDSQLPSASAARNTSASPKSSATQPSAGGSTPQETEIQVNLTLDLSDVLQNIENSSREQALAFVRQKIANISSPTTVATTQNMASDRVQNSPSPQGKQEQEIEVSLTEQDKSRDTSTSTITERQNTASPSSTPAQPSGNAVKADVNNAIQDHELAVLEELEAALEQLPENSTVPPNFAQRLPLFAQAANASVPTEASEAPHIPPPPPPFAKPLSSSPSVGTATPPTTREGNAETIPTPQGLDTSKAPLTQNQSVEQDPASAPAASFSAPSAPTVAPARTRVGAPSVSTRRPASRPAPSLTNRLLQPMAMMMALNSQQALDRGTQQTGDSYSNVLNQDTSVPSDSSTDSSSSPLSIHSALPTPYAQPAQEGEDVPTTTNEQAQAMRLASEQARATKEQFSGPEQEPQPAPPSEQGEPSSPLTPEQQLETTPQLQAAQQQAQMDKNTQQNQDQNPKAEEEKTRVASTSSTAEKVQAEVTRIKLVYDLIEGLFDWSFGFLQFLAESNLAIVNDKYLKVKILPSLKIKGEDPRTERYMHYAIYVLNVLLFFLLLIIAAFVIIIITTISAPGAAFFHAVT